MAFASAFAMAFMSSAVIFPAHFMTFRMEMPILRTAGRVVPPVIIIPVIVDLIKWIPADSVRDAFDAHGYPGTVVKRSRVPETSTPEPVSVAVVIEIIRYPDRNVKAQFRRRDKFRGLRDRHWRSNIYRRRGDTDIHAHIEIDVCRLGLCYR